VWIYNLADDGVSEWNTQVGHFLDLRNQTRSLSDLAAYFAFSQPGDAKITSMSVQCWAEPSLRMNVNGTLQRLRS
jgi:hypothetical protein